MRNNFNRRQLGFTLIEIMIGLGILAVLMGIGVPAYQDFIKNSCLTTTSTSLVSALQTARSEAIKQRANMSVVANADTNDVDGDSNVTEVLWDAGWSVQDAGGTVIKQFYKGGCDITTMAESAGNTTITYAPTGFLNLPATVTMRVCDDRNNQQQSSPGREISVSATGRPSTDSRYTGAGCPN
jgi:type IV fimbrial biogenesis protein FimT